MATVTPSFSITSSDLLSDNLSLSVSSSVTAANTTGLARRPVTSTAKGTAAGQVTVYTASDFSAPAYLYVKNTDSTASNYIYVYADTAADDPVILKLAGGDFAFMPIDASVTLSSYSTAGTEVIEYMVIGTDA